MALSPPTQRLMRAFTLMEVLVAVVIFAIVLAAINTVFYSALRLREGVAVALDQSLPMTHAFSILRRDLLGTQPPGGVLVASFKGGNVTLGLPQNNVSGTTQGASVGLGQNSGLGLGQGIGSSMGQGMGLNSGQGMGLDFYTTTGFLSDTAPWGDLQRVIYQLKDPADRAHAKGRDLIRSVNRNLLATTTEEYVDQWLMGDIEDWEVACYDGLEWRDTWDTTLGDTNLPLAIRIRILPAANPGENARNRQPFEMVLPLVSQSRTNQTQSTETQP